MCVWIRFNSTHQLLIILTEFSLFSKDFPRDPRGGSLYLLRVPRIYIMTPVYDITETKNKIQTNIAFARRCHTHTHAHTYLRYKYIVLLP